MLLSGCFMVPTSPEVPYTNVDVLVVDQDFLPVVGARVEAWGGLRRAERRNVDTTPEGGRVQFRLPPARYDVYAHPPEGYTHIPPRSSTHAIAYADPENPPPLLLLRFERVDTTTPVAFVASRGRTEHAPPHLTR